MPPSSTPNFNLLSLSFQLDTITKAGHLFLGLLLSWLFRRGFSAEAGIQRWNVTPLGAWLFDLLENLGIVTMLTIYPSTPAWLSWLTAVFTMTKWCFAGASLLLALFWGAAAIWKAVLRLHTTVQFSALFDWPSLRTLEAQTGAGILPC